MKRISLFTGVFQLVLLTTLHAQSWSLTGNSGTSPSTNFIGTTDGKPLLFKTNNKERMRILSGGQIGIGVKTPVQMLDVNGNINMSAGSSLFIDNHKIVRVDLATQNIFLGTGAGTPAISGTGNTSAGNNALYSITTGTANTAIGTAALFSNATADVNTAIGNSALYSNTDGVINTAVGVNSMYKNTTGSSNTAHGAYSLQNNISGNSNTAIGYLSLAAITASNGNAAIGDGAGAGLVNGSLNTFIGTATAAHSDNIDNSTAIGYTCFLTASNEVRIGNSSITSIGGYTNWTNISDGRVKKNIRDNVPGLAFISKLKPVTYNLDLDAADKILQRNVTKKENNKLTEQHSQKEIDSRNAKQQIVYTGFVAQDVEKAAKELNYDFSGVDAAKNEKDLYGLRYAEFVVPLVKAVQELSSENEKVKSKNEELEKRIKMLEEIINAKQTITASPQSNITSSINAALQQNTPNPFNGVTKINYILPKQYTSAKIIVTDKLGKTLKEVNLPAGRQGISNSGSLNIDASKFSSGAYQYSLIVDGKLIATKQMVLVK